MSLRRPWFLVMVPKAAARRTDFWAGYDTPCGGDVIARLVTPENRGVLAAFGIAWLRRIPLPAILALAGVAGYVIYH